MAVKPLFVKDRSTLLQSLRLSGKDESSSQQIDDAIVEARRGFYDQLGSDRVNELAAITRSDEPSTNDELARALAESVERKWVRLVLMRTMPTFFLNGTASHQQAWNEEGLLRDADFRLEDEINRLQSEVNCGLQSLQEGKTCEPNVHVIGPSEKNTYPGSSIFSNTRSLS